MDQQSASCKNAFTSPKCLEFHEKTLQAKTVGEQFRGILNSIGSARETNAPPGVRIRALNTCVQMVQRNPTRRTHARANLNRGEVGWAGWRG